MTLKLNHLQNLKSIFLKAVHSVTPHNLLTPDNGYRLNPLHEDGQLYVKIQQHKINTSRKRCHLVGFGKAVLGMAVLLERSLGDHLVSGILSIPKGTVQQFQGHPHMKLKDNTVIKIYEGAEHNQPDEISVQAAVDIKKLAQTLDEEDVLFVLISGGGSALLTLPRLPLGLQQKLKLIKELSHRGASIQEINSVRIALSDIKGGQLALAASKSNAIISLILSDIVGNPVHLIGSGPTCRISNPMKPEQILRKYELWQSLTGDVKNMLREEEEKFPDLRNNYLCVVGNNEIACRAAEQAAVMYNYQPFIVDTTIQGDVELLADKYTSLVQLIYAYKANLVKDEEFKRTCPIDISDGDLFLKQLQYNKTTTTNKPLLLIMGGEPTVKVQGKGLGGRNQELALRISTKLFKDSQLRNVYFLSAGTDGIDGPTPASGALACTAVVEDFLQYHNMEQLQCYLKENDSYNFYKNLSNGKYHICTGHTGTNVMDLHLLLLL